MSICHGVLVTYALKIKLKIFFLQNYDTRCIFLQSTKTMFFCQFCSFCLYILGDILLNFFGLLNHCQFWKYDSISCETVSMALQDAPWSMPWCPWNAAVEIYNFLLGCPQGENALVPLPFKNEAYRHVIDLFGLQIFLREANLQSQSGKNQLLLCSNLYILQMMV